MTPADWDAPAYHRISEPQFAWGLKVLEGLGLRGDETVLDAGCGSGRLTAVLLERLPYGKVIALDASQPMLDQAKATLLPRFEGRVELIRADLGALTLERVADVIFSAATFHWILDHDALFRGLFRALRPDGRLWAQCGGGDNLSAIHGRASRLMRQPPYAPHFREWKEPTNFARPEETRARLAAAGFTDVQVRLVPAPTPFRTREAFAEFIEKVVLRHHLARLPPEQRLAFLSELVDQAARDEPPFMLDYWRLNLSARRTKT